MTTAVTNDAGQPVDFGPAVRVHPSANDPTTMMLALSDQSMVPNHRQVARWIDQISDAAPAVRRIRTGALFAGSAPAFTRAGFTVHEHLHLLTLDLARHPGPTAMRGTRRLRRVQHEQAAAVDRAAFGPSDGYGPVDLCEVRSATPLHRARSCRSGGTIVAYAITGAADHDGYLQRLAVHPDHRREGRATLLVADAVAWMRRKRLHRALVNTGTHNSAALALYEHVGFERSSTTLDVLELDLDARPSPSR